MQHTVLVGFAGSRNGIVSPHAADTLVFSLSRTGASFAVGCATGVDECFRRALAASAAAADTTVFCAFRSRIGAVERAGLRGICPVADAPSFAAALHRRTVSMVRRCSLLVAFPDDLKTGTWGKGSLLAFTTAVEHGIPVFVVTSVPPLATRKYTVKKEILFGIVAGYRVVSREAVHVR